MPSFRIATFNVINGFGGHVSFPTVTQEPAVEAVLARVDADVVAIQEYKVNTDSDAAWARVAGNLGYTLQVGPLAGAALAHARAFLFKTATVSLIDEGLMLNAPLDKTFNLSPYYGEFSIGGSPFLVFNCHFTPSCCGLPNVGDSGDFQRGLEFQRFLEWGLSLKAVRGGSIPAFFVGDHNQTPDDGGAVDYSALPSPFHPVAGSSIQNMVFPVYHGNFPVDGYEREGLTVLQPFREGTADDTTWNHEVADLPELPDDVRIDYIAATSEVTFMGSEIYSRVDDVGGGLTKAGSAPASTASDNASDHLALFADVTIP